MNGAARHRNHQPYIAARTSAIVAPATSRARRLPASRTASIRAPVTSARRARIGSSRRLIAAAVEFSLESPAAASYKEGRTRIGMPLTETQRAKAVNALKKKLRGACPMCGGNLPGR